MTCPLSDLEFDRKQVFYWNPTKKTGSGRPQVDYPQFPSPRCRVTPSACPLRKWSWAFCRDASKPFSMALKTVLAPDPNYVFTP